MYTCQFVLSTCSKCALAHSQPVAATHLRGERVDEHGERAAAAARLSGDSALQLAELGRVQHHKRVRGEKQ